jgi:hypothetical protein
VAVTPRGLYGIAAYHLPRGEVEAAIVVRHRRQSDLAEDIGFTPARGTGTVTAKEFESKVGLAAVIPSDGKFGSDFLNRVGLEWLCHWKGAGFVM